MTRLFWLTIAGVLVGCMPNSVGGSLSKGSVSPAITSESAINGDPTPTFQVTPAESQAVPPDQALATPPRVSEIPIGAELMPSKTPTLFSKTSMPSPDPSEPVQMTIGNLQYEILFLEENMPRANSRRYVPPSAADLGSFTALMNAILQGNIADASLKAAAENYVLLQFKDFYDDKTSYLLLENDQNFRGWGLYALRQDNHSQVIVEAPHPIADENTPFIALQVYRALEAKALLVAGAHRNANRDGSADVAHEARSIFQAVHLTLLTSDSIVLQIHGFSSAKHPDHPQVVIGQVGDGTYNLAEQLAAKLEEAGVSAGVCSGDAWRDLCGDTNVQASAMRQGIFLHLELDESIRRDPQVLLDILQEMIKQ